jgi:CBS domain-containing protein
VFSAVSAVSVVSEMIKDVLILSSGDVEKKQHIHFGAVYLRVLVMIKVTFLTFRQ